VFPAKLVYSGQAKGFFACGVPRRIATLLNIFLGIFARRQTYQHHFFAVHHFPRIELLVFSSPPYLRPCKIGLNKRDGKAGLQSPSMLSGEPFERHRKKGQLGVLQTQQTVECFFAR